MTNFINELYIFSFSFIAIVILSFIIFYVLTKKQIIKASTNYYTGKQEWRNFMDFVRVLCLFAGTIFSYFVFSLWVGILVNLAFLFVFYTFIRTLGKDEAEELLLTIAYTEEEKQKWKESLPKKKYPRVKTVFSDKVVFTSRFIYLSKRKRIDVKSRELKNFYIKRVSFQDHFMILHYYYSQAAVFDHYFYVPKSKQQKLKKEYGSHFKFQL